MSYDAKGLVLKLRERITTLEKSKASYSESDKGLLKFWENCKHDQNAISKKIIILDSLITRLPSEESLQRYTNANETAGFIADAITSLKLEPSGTRSFLMECLLDAHAYTIETDAELDLDLESNFKEILDKGIKSKQFRH